MGSDVEARVTISTRVLDWMSGRGAGGVRVQVDSRGAGVVAEGVTGLDGCLVDWNVPGPLDEAGAYYLMYDTSAYFAELGHIAAYSEIRVAIAVGQAGGRYEWILLIAPHGYATFCRVQKACESTTGES
jgi:5-hydroxyisourate hydrolase-like protein (transthyretin family)